MQRLLVTGSTGRVGRQLVAQLLSADAEIRALTRDPEAADLPPGVEVVRGDLTNPSSLDPCLDGVDAVFLVWTAAAETAPQVVELMAQHVRRVVFLSSPHKTAHPLFQQPNPLKALHAGVERFIEESGLEWTFLRPGMFAANALSWWAPQIRVGDVVRWPYGEAPTAPIHERDIAEVAMHGSSSRGTTERSTC